MIRDGEICHKVQKPKMKYHEKPISLQWMLMINHCWINCQYDFNQLKQKQSTYTINSQHIHMLTVYEPGYMYHFT